MSSAWTRRWLDVPVQCRLKIWYFQLYLRRFRCFIRAALDASFAMPPESRVIVPFTLIFSVELPLNLRLSRLVWTPLKATHISDPCSGKQTRSDTPGWGEEPTGEQGVVLVLLQITFLDRLTNENKIITLFLISNIKESTQISLETVLKVRLNKNTWIVTPIITSRTASGVAVFLNTDYVTGVAGQDVQHCNWCAGIL